MTNQPFTIDVSQAVLDDLQSRLERTRWPGSVAGAGWERGTEPEYLQALVAYWRDHYDWRTMEAQLNTFRHFRTLVDGFGLHFTHERGHGPNPTPLLLTHGWPDSFFRFYKLIPMLTDPERFGGSAEDAFDVVVPSLPGYGFSDQPEQPGMTAERVADLFAQLMADLGYQTFAAHGGDVGSSVTEQLARRHGDALLGIHLTDVPYHHLFSVPEDDLTDAEQRYLETGRAWQLQEGAYALQQGTKPQTLAYGLNDSPVGLAGWLVEKFRSWSDCGGDVETRFSKDELLTNIMLYWVTQSIGSSFLPYYESRRRAPEGAAGRVSVPTGVAIFPKDLVLAPRAFGERFFNVQRWTEMPSGGHFAALEEPELLAEDVRAFFRSFRG